MKANGEKRTADGGKQQEATARKAQGTRSQPDPDGAKPDEEQVEEHERAHLHLGASEIESEANEGGSTPTDDAKHGFSQDSGYAQSGGQKAEPRKRTN